MSIPLVLERFTPESFRLVAAGQGGVRPVAEEQGIDKQWATLLAVLNNGEEPPPFVTRALTGPPELVEDDDDWYHVLGLRDPAMTEQLARALEAVDESELAERYYRTDFTGVYSSPDYPYAEDCQTTVYAFRLLRDFYTAAAAASDAVTVEILA